MTLEFKWPNLLIILIICVLMLAIITIPAEAWTYTVRPGDSLWSIARRTGVTVNSIKAASGHWSNTIWPGQSLEIPSNNYNSNWISSSERDLLARVVEAEAGGEPYIGKVSVAAVVLNRRQDSRFPGTINGIIYQRHAFEAVTNGLIWRKTPTQESYNAIREAVNGWDPTYGSVFFWNPYVRVNPWVWSRPIVVQYGRHVFAR